MKNHVGIVSERQRPQPRQIQRVRIPWRTGLGMAVLLAVVPVYLRLLGALDDILN